VSSHHLAQFNIARMAGPRGSAEGVERVDRLRADGPGPEAFTFRERYQP
jgi:hypothetical protein